MKTNPANYKTQAGLIKALSRIAECQMSVKIAWWLSSAQFALINNFGWEEETAAKFIAAYHPKESAYRATS
jgi:hypothetical protein